MRISIRGGGVRHFWAVGFVMTLLLGSLAWAMPASAAATAQKLTNGSLSTVVKDEMGPIKIATGSTTRGVSGKTITISGIASVTQAGQPALAGACDGAAAAFARANKTGGVNGYKINYLGCKDDGTVATVANQLTQQAVDQNKDFAVVPYSSAVGSTTLLNQDHVPYFGFGLDQAAYCGWNNLQFGFSATSAEGCIGALKGESIFSDVGLVSYVDGAKVNPTKQKLAILSEAVPTNEDAGQAEVLMAKELGMKVVYDQPAIPGPQSPQLTNYAPIAQAIKSSGATFLFDDASGASVISVAGELKSIGWTGGFQQFTFTDASYLGVSAVAQAMDGAYALTAQIGSPAFPSPQMKQVATDLKAIGSKASLGLGTLTSYGAAELFLAALKKVQGPLTTEKLAAVLNKGFNYPGYGNVICPSEWPASRVAASSCGAEIQLNGKTASLNPLLNTGNYGNPFLIKGLSGGS